MFPVPQKITSRGENISLTCIPAVESDKLAENIISQLSLKKIPFCTGGNISLEVVFDQSRRLTYIEENRRVTDEKYILEIDGDSEKIQVRLLCSCTRSLGFALNALARMIEANSFTVGTIEDYPLFAKRGFIEGFYGKPWNNEERFSVLELMSRNNMNTYFYAPKDDAYHRDKWNIPYPPEELAGLTAVFEKASLLGFDFCYCIGPGLSMRYSDEAHFSALLEKLRPLFDVGIRSFGLLLDDIPEELQYPQDKEMFGETVAAHIKLANRLFDGLTSWSEDVSLTLCPLQYHGRGDEYFISKLGRGIDPRISLFWTGHNICSQELTVPEAVTFITSTRHMPLYWDNFPVNDAEMFNEMHIGFLDGREHDLYRYSEGLIANCMEYAECSKIPLLTVADYLWNPEKYDPAASWDNALKTVVGDDAEIFKVYAENMLVSCLKVPNCPMFCDMIFTLNYEIKYGNLLKAMGLLSDYLEKLDAAVALLERRAGEKLFIELAPWTEKFLLYAELLRLCADVIFSGEREIVEEIAEKLEQFKQMPKIMSEFAFQSTVEQLIFGGM